ncbi:MAG: hypothetical protein IJ302_10390 [Clostridia bacterium]|nr:hypothetical protein [Clostridia bacterium]MBQ8370657.1 hypothetical protein [Clostridia bacterium]MBQ8512596.1 hypothetical protein [Clostridia bacterium]
MNMAKMTKTNAAAGANKMASLSKNEAGRIVLSRILIIILADIIVGSLFDFVRSEANREFFFHETLLPVLQIVFGACLVLSLAYLAVTLVKKIDTSAQYMTPAMISALALYLFVTVMFYDRFRGVPVLFYTMTVIVSVLFAVYYIYTIILYKK